MVIKVDLDAKLEKRFRELAMKKFGYSKGSIKKATETAIRKWAAEETTAEKKTGEKKRSSVSLIAGGLAHLKGKKTSVELQHEVKEMWI
jgi:hypothetical protein